MKFTEYKQIDYPSVGSEILQYWKTHQIFEQSVSSKEGKPTFTFYEGPPSANGIPGIHHVMARTVKDIVCRYKTMQGFQVKRKGGWDTHGLPVELQVEKKLGITKEDIGTKVSVEEYNRLCRESVMEFKEQWDNVTEKMGYWVDLQNPYITFENNYIESLWHILKTLHEKGFLYKGHTIQPYSPAAGTGLSSHELNQPGCYRDVKDTSVIAQFEVVKNEAAAFLFEGETNPVYFVAWTTTPWTLPSNAALAVGPKIRYVKVRTKNKYTHEAITVILAKELLAKHIAIEKEEGEVIAEYSGEELCGITYHQLMPYVQPEGKAFCVIAGDFVSTEDGTGIVHIAPTFGADDARVAKQAGIASITVKDEAGNDVPLVNKKGQFVNEVTDFALEYVKEAYLTDEEKETARLAQGRDKYLTVDERISIMLKEANKAFKVEKYEHSYPHCWRTDKPVLYYPLESWFIKTTAVKDRLVALNKTINWKPESTGQGRFGNWLENLVDWNLSRSRFWGTPLPIWRSEDGTEEYCIGSIAELNEKIAEANRVLGINEATLTQKEQEYATKLHNLLPLEDMHRPYIDRIVLVSPAGKVMFREADLIDVWFDSGAMPYAQWHFPFENKDVFEKNFPADFIAEGVDQTRGWFFTLHVLATMLFDSVAFKNVIANGLVLDKNGNKMSKRLGNGIDPFITIDKYGPDATRWYMITNSPPWDNLKFNVEGITEVQRRFFGTYHNTYNFFALYANLDNFHFEQAAIPAEKRTESDRWVLSRLHSLIKTAKAAFDDYDLTKAGRAIQDFVNDELSNWYVRLNRKRFWKGEYNEDKIMAYQTLAECLETVARLAAPIAPFYFDKMYGELNKVIKLSDHVSVHLVDFPVANEAVIDTALEYRMSLAQRASSLVHSLRKGKNLKVRQPLSKILIPVFDNTFKSHLQAIEDLIKSEVNVKTIEYLGDDSTVLVKKVKPNFKKLGAEYGAKMKLVAGLITSMSQQQITQLEKENALSLLLEGENITLTKEDVEITFQDIPGWLVATDNELTVALDITITDELKQEGIARDFVNRVQNLRKELGMEVQDKIYIKVLNNNEVASSALLANQVYICSETQALALDLADSLQGGHAVDMDEFTLDVIIEK